MSNNDRVSDELLNAFVDDELDKAERERVFELLEQDPLLAQRLCELTHMKELVRAARPHPDESTLHNNLHIRRSYVQGYAAMLLMMVSVGLMVYFFNPSSFHPAIDQTVRAVVDQHAHAAEIKVVMQITRNDATSFSRLLDQAEMLVKLSTQMDKPVRVEIVAYGKGLSLLREGGSPYAQRIQQLHRQYDNVLFVACQETLDKQLQKGSMNVRLLPGVVIVHSGAGEVKLRRSQGWTLMKA